MLRLLVPNDNPTSEPTIQLNGRHWEVIEVVEVESPSYVCITYAWGHNVTTNVLYGGSNLMSSRIISVLETAIQALEDPNPALWIDAFCLPPRGDPLRHDAIDQMGDIYLGASKVIVVLSKDSGAFLKIAKHGIKGAAGVTHVPALKALDQDEWVTRSWTYQEIANAKGWLFVAEGNGKETAVDGFALLNGLGNAKMAYRRHLAQGDDTVAAETQTRLQLPHADLLEEVLLACVVGAPLEMSALQVMSNVNRRIQEREEDYFNAMLGAIVRSKESTSIRLDWKIMAESALVKELENQLQFKDNREGSVVDEILRPLKVAYAANRFMQACERKSDYSFIYTTAKRSELDGQGWRPVPEILCPVCPWHSYGASQRGEIHHGRLELQDMFPTQAGNLTASAERFIATWVQIFFPAESDSHSVEKVRLCLRQVGFSPSDESQRPFVLKDGYFFPQWSVDFSDQLKVYLSSSIRWNFGAPAICVDESGDLQNGGKFVSPGVFIGDVFAIARNTEKRRISLI